MDVLHTLIANLFFNANAYRAPCATGRSFPFITVSKDRLRMKCTEQVNAIYHPSYTNAYTALYKNVFQPWAGDYVGSLLFAVTHVMLFLLVGWLLGKKKILCTRLIATGNKKVRQLSLPCR